MHPLAIVPILCLSLCGANGSSNQQRPTDSVYSSNSQQFSSAQIYRRATGKENSSQAEETKILFRRTANETSEHTAQVNSSALSNTTSSIKIGKDATRLAFQGNASSPSNVTSQEDITAHYTTYNVWTINSTDGNGNKAIWNFLVSLGVDGSDINVLGLPPGLDDTDAFQLRLTPAQYKNFNNGSQKLENLDFIAQTCVTGCAPISSFIEEPTVENSGFSKRDFAVEFGRPWDLAYLSQPKTTAEGVGASMADINGRYVYDPSSAEGVTIYMVDTGANPDHVEFSQIKQNWEWAGPDYTRTADGGYSDGVQGDYASATGSVGHGTMMLSVIAGHGVGAVKKPLMVIVRTQQEWGPLQVLQNIEYVLWHWQNHRDDGRNKVGIISLSIHFWELGDTSIYSKDHEKALTTIKTRMAQCIRAGLLPIAASGNNGGPVNTWPALFRSTQNWAYRQPPLSTVPLPNLVVVGATDNDGKIWSGVNAHGVTVGSQTADFVDLTAPGVNINAALTLGPQAYGAASGTSQACARTAGIAAYLAGHPSITSGWKASTPISTRLNKVRETLLDLAYHRKLNDPLYPLGIWNGNTYIPAPPNSIYVPICGYVSSNEKRDASCAFEPSTYEQGPYKPIPSGEPGAYETVSSVANSSISIPKTSTSSLAPSSISLSPISTTSLAPTKSTTTASSPSASPYTNIQYTNITVQTGNLLGPAISDFISSGLKGICPPTPDGIFESCNGKFSQDVEFMIPGDGNYIIQEGSVSFGIPLSNYSSTANRDGMIAALAAFHESMATNGTANCQTNISEWEDDECEPGQEKREEGPGGSGTNPGSLPGTKCKKVVPMTYCQIPSIVQLEITENNKVTEYMTIVTSFTVEGEGFLHWLCEEFAAFVGDFMEYLAPELTEEYPQVVGQVEASCNKELADFVG